MRRVGFKACPSVGDFSFTTCGIIGLRFGVAYITWVCLRAGVLQVDVFIPGAEEEEHGKMEEL